MASNRLAALTAALIAGAVVAAFLAYRNEGGDAGSATPPTQNAETDLAPESSPQPEPLVHTTVASAEPAALAKPPQRLVVLAVDRDGRPIPQGEIYAHNSELDDGIPRGPIGEDGTFARDVPGPGTYSVGVNCGFALIGTDERSAATKVEVLPGVEETRAVLRVPGSIGTRTAGTLLDHAGAPAAEVRITSLSTTLSAYEHRFECMTDAEGRFALYGHPSSTPIQISALKENIGRLDETQVRSGAEGIVLRLLAPGGVRGQVVDEAGMPIPSFEVTLHSGDMQNLYSGAYSMTAVEDAEGRFSFDEFVRPKAFIVARAEGFAPNRIEAFVRPGETVEGLVIRLNKGRSIAGAVFSNAGDPIPGARVGVYASGISHDEPATIGYSATSDAEGRYTIAHMAPGEYVLAAEAPETMRAVQEVTVSAERDASVNWTLFAGGVIEGRILRDGRPVEGRIEISNFRQPPAIARSYVLEPSSDFTDPARRTVWHLNAPNGGFRIDNLAPATYYIVVEEGAGDDETPHRLEVDGGRLFFDNPFNTRPPTRVVIQGGETAVVDIELGAAGAVIEGVVLCNGAPMAGLRVDAISVANGVTAPAFAETDENGQYRIEGVQAGRIFFFVAAGDCVTNYLLYAKGRGRIVREFPIGDRERVTQNVELDQVGSAIATADPERHRRVRFDVYLGTVDITAPLPQRDEPGHVVGSLEYTMPGEVYFPPVEPGRYLFAGTDRNGAIVAGPVWADIELGKITELAF